MMRMKNALGAALLLIPFAAGATTSYTFDSLTKIQYGGSTTLTLTGILLGDSAPSTVGLPPVISQCDAYFNEMLSTSGKYLLNVTTEVQDPPFPGGIPTVRYVSCSLERKP